jgi:hypothetical protein
MFLYIITIDSSKMLSKVPIFLGYDSMLTNVTSGMGLSNITLFSFDFIYKDKKTDVNVHLYTYTKQTYCLWKNDYI